MSRTSLQATCPLDSTMPESPFALVLALLAIVVVVGTLLPLIPSDIWWIRAWDFSRFQLLALGLGVLATRWIAKPPRVVRHEEVLVVLLVVAVAYQVFRILPYTPWWSKQSLDVLEDTSNDTLSILISNVLMDNRESDRLVALVRERQPDLLFAAETDDWWVDRLAPLKSIYPHVVERPLDNTYGFLLYSKRPLIEPDVRHLMHSDVPSLRARTELDSGRIVQLYFLHPKPPYPGESPTTTRRDAEILIVGREVRESVWPTVVAGDLNDVAWSRTTRLFQRLSGLLDPRIGRGLYSTFHAKIPIMRWPLDHVFHSDHFSLVALERLPAIGSDHFPIFVELAFEREAALVQEAPAPEPGDHDLVDEKIEAGVEELIEEGTDGAGETSSVDDQPDPPARP